MFRTITIDPVLNGYSVGIRFPEGEQELVFNTLDDLLRELREYYTDPQGVEEHYRNTTNAQHIMSNARQASAGVDYPLSERLDPSANYHQQTIPAPSSLRRTGTFYAGEAAASPPTVGESWGGAVASAPTGFISR